VQIGGGGVPSVCTVIPPGVTVFFPPRNETVAFGQALNEIYRDVLRRGPVSAFVDLEGWIVWVSEYLRYRASGCSNIDATSRVNTQISGGGVPADCGGTSGGTGAGTGTLLVRGGPNACICWFGTITVQVDGVTRGTLSCSTSVAIPVATGLRSVRVCDSGGCVSDTLLITSGVTLPYELFCTARSEGAEPIRQARLPSSTATQD
jgi:hypothetical protein